MSTNSDLLKKYRAQAVADGRCATCRARPAKAGCKTCEACIAATAERQRRHREAGKCPCGRKRVRGLSACRACLDRRLQASRLSYAQARALGKCVRHGCHEAARQGHIHCDHHAAEAAANARRMSHALREAGLCVGCGAPNQRGTWRCERCSTPARRKRKAQPEIGSELIEEHW